MASNSVQIGRSAVVMKSGYVEKKRATFGGYVKRFFVFESSGEIFQSQNNDSRAKEKRVVELKRGEAFVVYKEGSKSFEVKSKCGKSLTLRTKSIEESQEWVNILSSFLKDELTIDSKSLNGKSSNGQGSAYATTTDITNDDDSDTRGEETVGTPVKTPSRRKIVSDATKSASKLRQEQKRRASVAALVSDLKNSPSERSVASSVDDYESCSSVTPSIDEKNGDDDRSTPQVSLDQHFWSPPHTLKISTGLPSVRDAARRLHRIVLNEAVKAIKIKPVLVLDAVAESSVFSAFGGVGGGRYVEGVQKDLKLAIPDLLAVARLDNRKRMTHASAIYMLSPKDPSSVELLLSDFDRRREAPLYTDRIIVLFTEQATKETLELLNACRAFREKLCRELLIVPANFSTATSPSAASLALPNAFRVLHRPASPDFKDTTTRAAERFVSVCSALQEYPFVRFCSSSPIVVRLAFLVERSLRDFIGSHPTYKFNADRGTVVIIDRMEDLLTPLFQDVRLSSITSTWLRVCNDSKVHPPPTYVDRCDEDIFATFAHAYTLNEMLKESLDEESNEKWRGNSKEKSNMLELLKLVERTVGTPNSTERIAAMELELAHGVRFWDKKKADKMGAKQRIPHLKACVQAVEKLPMAGLALRRLLAIAMLTSESPDDGPQTEQDLVELGLSRGHAKYVIHLKQLHAHRPGMIIHSKKASLESSDAVKHIGVAIKNRRSVKREMRRRGSSIKKFVTTKNKVFKGVDTENLPHIHSRNVENIFTLQKRGCVLRNIAEGQLLGTLVKDQFPYVVDPPARRRSSGTLKSDKSDNDILNSTAASSPRCREAPKQGRGPRLVVFVVGGVTYAEIALLRDLERATGRSITIVSTSFESADSFIESAKGA